DGEAFGHRPTEKPRHQAQRLARSNHHLSRYCIDRSAAHPKHPVQVGEAATALHSEDSSRLKVLGVFHSRCAMPSVTKYGSTGPDLTNKSDKLANRPHCVDCVVQV